MKPSSQSSCLMALFEDATIAAEAIDGLHAAGVMKDQIVVMSGVPYPEGALGRHSEWLRLPQVVLAGALGGMLVGAFLTLVTPHLYVLEIGGRPTIGAPPAILIIFVFTMMATIISTFLGVLWEMDFPEFGPKHYHVEVTHGKLVLVVEFLPALKAQVESVLRKYGGQNIHAPERQSL